MGIATDCESQQASTLREIGTDFADHLAGLSDVGHGGKCSRSAFMWYLLMMPDNYYTGIRVLCAIRDDPNDAVRVPMQRAITRDVLRNKDQMDVSTLVKLVSQATEDAVPNEFVMITTVPEMMYKNWQSNQRNVLQRPAAIWFNQQSFQAFVVDQASNKLKLLDTHTPCNVVDVLLRCEKGVPLTSCKGITQLGDFLIFLTSINAVNSGILVLNAKLLISRSSNANAEGTDGATSSARRNKKGEKTRAKVAKVFPLELLRVSDVVPTMREPFSAVVASDRQSLYVADTKLGSVMQVSSINFESAQAVLKECFKVQQPRGMGMLEDKLFVVDGEQDCIQVVQLPNFEKLHTIPIPNAHTPHSLLFVGRTMFLTDFGAHSLQKCEVGSGGEASWQVVVSGDGSKQPLQDGVVSSSTLFQPQTMSSAGNSIFIADSGNGAIRMLTNAPSVKPFLKHIRGYLASFGIPRQEHALSLGECKGKTQALLQFFTNMSTNNSKRSTRGLNGEGPFGNVSQVNRRQLQWLLDGIGTIEREMHLMDSSHLLPTVSPHALQELLCERYFALMRKHHPMPSQAEYYNRRAVVNLELQKMRMPRDYHYFTGKYASYYPMDSIEGKLTGFAHRQKVLRRNVKLDTQEWTLIKKKRSELVTFQQQWGIGVKQVTVRSRTTKEEAGALPYSVSFRPRADAVSQNAAELQLPVAPDAVHSAPGAVEQAQTWAEVKYCVGDFICLRPSQGARKRYKDSGSVWFAQLQTDIIHICERVPKAVGSRKRVVKKKPQDVFTRLRWLEVSEDGDGNDCGRLYEWDDGAFDGDGDVVVDEGCKQDSVLCRVAFAKETSEDGCVRYRLPQGEMDRVDGLLVASASHSSDDSSDGVDDDFCTNVIGRQAIKMIAVFMGT